MSEMKITDKEIEYIVTLAFENVDLECENKRLKRKIDALRTELKSKEIEVVLKIEDGYMIGAMKGDELLN